MKKKLSISKLKAKAWNVFSKWVRSIRADWKGEAQCVTCGVRKPWKELQAGHFIPGRHNSILFNEYGCHPQCYRCNVPLKGNPRAYDAYMRKTYGEETIKELEKEDRKLKQWKREELEEIISKYTLKSREPNQ